MTTVSYAHQFEYGYDQSSLRLPLLKFRVSSLSDPGLMVEVEGALDSGAERSLLNGRIGVALGLDVVGGPRLEFETMSGSRLSATLHPVRLSHAKLGTFFLEVAFSTGDVRRNVFGRDFFDLVQIGFREHQLTFFVTPAP